MLPSSNLGQDCAPGEASCSSAQHDPILIRRQVSEFSSQARGGSGSSLRKRLVTVDRSDRQVAGTQGFGKLSSGIVDAGQCIRIFFDASLRAFRSETATIIFPLCRMDKPWARKSS